MTPGSPKPTVRARSPPPAPRASRLDLRNVLSDFVSGNEFDFSHAVTTMSDAQLKALIDMAVRDRRIGPDVAGRLSRAILDLRGKSSWLTTLVRHCIVDFNAELDDMDEARCEELIAEIPNSPPHPLKNATAQMQRQETLQRDASEALQYLATSGPSGLGALLARRILKYAGLRWVDNLPDTPAWRLLRSRTKTPVDLFHLQRELGKGGTAVKALSHLKKAGYR
jgi:hypothetical protein